MSQKIPIPGGGLWPPRSEEKPQQNKFVPFIPAAMQRQMASEEQKRKEEMSQESVEDIAISAVPYDDGESDEYIRWNMRRWALQHGMMTKMMLDTLRTMMTFRFNPSCHGLCVHAVQLGNMVHAGSRLIHCFHFGCVVRCSSRCV